MAGITTSRKGSRGKVSYSIVGGWFVKSIGYRKTASGKIGPARFYLSKQADDPKGIDADAEASKRRKQWQGLQESGVQVWPESLLPDASPLRIVPTTATGHSGKKATVSEAVADYLADRYHGAFKPITIVAAKYRIESAAAHLGFDYPMASLDEDKIKATVLAICSRPKVKDGNESISMTTANDWLGALYRFLVWANEEDRYGFTLPRRFERIFRENHPKPSADEIRASGNRIDSGKEVDHFDLSELTTIYQYATARQRAWVLLMLNCGFANEELNDLHRAELKGMDGPNPYIARIRKKTIRCDRPQSEGVFAKWNLWPETVTALRSFAFGDDYVLRTHHGNRLIEATDKGRKDAVYTSWQRLYDRMKDDAPKDQVPRWLPPKFIRKTAAHLVRTMPEGGKEVADQFLSHADTGVITHYAGREWDKVAVVTAKLRELLQPIFDAAKAYDGKVKGAQEAIKRAMASATEEEVTAGVKLGRKIGLNRARWSRAKRKAVAA